MADTPEGPIEDAAAKAAREAAEKAAAEQARAADAAKEVAGQTPGASPQNVGSVQPHEIDEAGALRPRTTGEKVPVKPVNGVTPVVETGDAAVKSKWGWINPKGREFSLGEGGALKKVGKVALAGVGLGAVWSAVKDIAHGTGVSTEKDEQGNEISAGVGTLLIGLAKLGVGATLIMNMITQRKGAAIAR